MSVLRKREGPFIWRPTLNRGHALTQGLVGCWTASFGKQNQDQGVYAPELCREDPYDRILTVGFGSGKLRHTAAGLMIERALETPNNTTPSALLRPTENVSIFWYGMFRDNNDGSNSMIAGMYHNASNSAPFHSYGIYRSSDTNVEFSFNNAGSFGSITGSNVVSSTEYERPISLSASYGTGVCKGYRNGLEIASGGGISGITYNTSGGGGGCRFALDRNIATGGESRTDTALVLVYNRALSPTEHLALAIDPFQIFLPTEIWPASPELVARVSQDVIELLSQPIPDARVTQNVIEILSLNVTDATIVTSFLSSTLTLTAPTIEAAPGGAFISSSLTLFAPTVAVELFVFTPVRISGTTLTAPTVGNYDVLTDLIASSALLNSPTITTELPEFTFNPLSIWP